MICRIQNKEIPPELFYFRERKYGTPTPGYQLLEYELAVTHADFIAAFADYYDDWAKDDQEFGFDADEIDVKLRRKGWPSLQHLLSRDRELLESFLATDTSYSAIQEIFQEHPQHDRHYLINSVEAVKISDQNIEFRGKAICIKDQGKGNNS